jgi:hypothetical protein
MFLVYRASTLGLDTTSVSDAGSTRVVVIVTLLLIGLGIGLGILNIWFWRKTKPDPEALGPLVEMSSRKFAELGLIEQRHRLDQVRPSLASEPSVESLPALQSPIILENESQDFDDEVIDYLVVSEEVDQEVSRNEVPLLSTSVNDIDWDDDEWPDVDDWSLPVDRLKDQDPVLLHELFDQDQDPVQEIDVEVVAEAPKERPVKGPVSIDPLLGF